MGKGAWKIIIDRREPDATRFTRFESVEIGIVVDAIEAAFESAGWFHDRAAEGNQFQITVTPCT